MENSLTSRELEVLELMSEGLTNPQIAKILTISIHTVKAHVCSIIEKLNVNGRVQASVKAVKIGII
jgi:DNA-binding NarL/FixJ family response regulator